MKDSEILIEARKLIQSGAHSHICFALSYIYGQAREKLVKQTTETSLKSGEYDEKLHSLMAQYENLLGWIVVMLDGANVYEGWLQKFHPQIYLASVAQGETHTLNMRNARLAWLDWMIDECRKAEGA